MLIKNSKKIVIKLGSSTVVDKNGKFKSDWVNSLIKDIKKYYKIFYRYSFIGGDSFGAELLENKTKKNKNRHESSYCSSWPDSFG